jgi:DNA-binding beta-propeller fold protein YncE/phospholipase C
MLSLILTVALQEPQMLPTGKMISPIGEHTEVGSYPIHMVRTKDGKHAVISTMGYRQSLSVVDLKTGKVTSQFDYKTSRNNPNKDGLYYGLAVHPVTGDIYVSRGAQDKVSSYKIDENGQISEIGTPIAESANPERKGLPLHFSGLAFNSNGSRIAVVNNQTSSIAGLGSIAIYETSTSQKLREIKVGGFPFDIAYKTKGAQADDKAYVSCERDSNVQVVDVQNGTILKSIRTGAAPSNLVFDRNQKKLFVSNNASDSISIIDTEKDVVAQTISIRPPELRGLPGASPLGMSLSGDEKTLYVALSDMQCVAAVSLPKGQVVGYIPTGWLPTDVVTTGSSLLITSAKGIQSKNPNGKPVGTKGTYIQDIIAGTVSKVEIPDSKSLKRLTASVINNNRLRPGLNSAKIKNFSNPGIKYVIYIVKENRTYDNVLGDLKQGNGDPSLTLFPRKVTPNQHALAERFVLMDNFYVCAEVSQDGWQWSTSGMASPYGSRNTPYNYSGRGRSYDTEGSNNGEPVELNGVTNVAKPAAGYIWEHCAKNKVSYRNYGMFSTFAGIDDKRKSAFPDAKDSFPLIKSLIGHTDSNFRHYDTNYADSPIYNEYNFEVKSQLKSFGEHKATNRFSAWKREFDQFVKKGSMPRFQSIRFGNDHTNGSRAGSPTAQSMVADNDYAVGLLVEAVSNSPFWKETAICILEDDAQNGIDHVDAHRSTAYVISPYINRSTVDSTFYNTDSMLRTMQLLLGMPPMSQYDAVATPFRFFASSASNQEPYKAIRPDQEIVCKLNSRTAYRAKDSEKINRYAEESEIDEELNDILWKSIKGIYSKTPTPKYGLSNGRRPRD